MEQFDDIRPYHDDELEDVLTRLLHDTELLNVLARLKLPGLLRVLPGLARKIVSVTVKRELKGITDIKKLQMLIKQYLDVMMVKSTNGFTTSGMEQMVSDKAYLFISNHRDIALDPALIDYAMLSNGQETVRIAIGDNLLSKPFAADLMRINKSFIVNRSAIGRQMLAAYKKLSAYIRFSLQEEHHSIWIAQREGRAKDSIDKTEPAIIKMLAMSRDKKSESLAEFVTSMNFVPVSISYEWDTLDAAKANELYQKANDGQYQKDAHEDLASIGSGITGQKGAVHIHFGEMLKDDFETPEQVAAAIDRQVLGNYVLHPSNFAAYYKIHGTTPDLTYGHEKLSFKIDEHRDAVDELDRRLAAQPDHLHPFILNIYANPIVSKLNLLS